MLLHHLLWLFALYGVAICDIRVFDERQNLTIAIVEDLPALFGPFLPTYGGLMGLAVKAIPHDGCYPPSKPPKIPGYFGSFVVIMKRYNCSFVEKVLNAQVSGYAAVIVRNVDSNSLEVMSGNVDLDFVNIPSVFIGEDDGLMIENNFLYHSGFAIVITDDLPFNIKDYLLPFAITIGVCFILLLSFMVIKCLRDYKQSRRHRLSSRALKKLPIHKFKKGDPYECCAVCLDDYVENEKLRVLPCSHAYHAKCIDPWLTKNRRVCPVCKRKVITGDERPSDLDTDSEDEAAPLVNSEAGTQGGTFNNQRENPFRVAAAERQQNRQQQRSRYHHLEEDSPDESSEAEEGLVATSNAQVVQISAPMDSAIPQDHADVTIRNAYDGEHNSAQRNFNTEQRCDTKGPNVHIV